ncbi:hypothetical protein EBT16_09675, partial [bacterium]|nr:hypothetical protein [bacterium]
LQQTDAKCWIVLTYFSPSAERALALESERRRKANLDCPWDFADYSPFDFVWSVRYFLSLAKPEAFIAVHREFWPEALESCRKNKIPCYLMGAFFPSPLSWFSFFYKTCLTRFKQIIAVDERTRNYLLAFRPGLPVVVLGDPRVERVLLRRKLFTSSQAWRPFFENQTILIGASFWEEDYQVFRQSVKTILEAFPQCRLILVPHEPSPGRLKKWKEDLSSLGLSFRLWSHWLRSPDSSSHLLVDKVGLLAELYSVGACVVVGGSFKRRVHNVLEPLVYECGVVTGPFIDNSSEARELGSRGILKLVHDSSELGSVVVELIQDPEKRQALIEGAHSFLKERENTSVKHVAVLLD